MKECAVCGEALAFKRRDAVYCSAACKQYAHRKRKKAANSRSVPGVAIATDADHYTVITIREGGKTRREQPEGPPPTPIVV
jgi:predicted nucleic acid-binding Zn ribbon protein